MTEYCHKGFKITYPEFMKKKSDFPGFQLKNTKDKSENDTLFFVILHNSVLSFKDFAGDFTESVRRDMADIGQEALRLGENPKFSGSREMLYTEIYPGGTPRYHWDLIIPVGPRVVDVSLAVYAKDWDEILEIWSPIFDSMEFEPDQIIKIPDPKEPINKFNWTKKSEKPRHRKISIPAEHAPVGLWDSGTELYDEEGDLEDAIDEDSFSRRFVKEDQKLILFLSRDGLELPVDFYFEAEAPEPSEGSYVIEGLIGAESGELCFGGWEPFVKIKLLKGVYKFRIYFGVYDEEEAEDAAEYWHIYLWPTNEKENNEVKILTSA